MHSSRKKTKIKLKYTKKKYKSILSAGGKIHVARENINMYKIHRSTSENAFTFIVFSIIYIYFFNLFDTKVVEYSKPLKIFAKDCGRRNVANSTATIP
jgi:hypothetical protein